MPSTLATAACQAALLSATASATSCSQPGSSSHASCTSFATGVVAGVTASGASTLARSASMAAHSWACSALLSSVRSSTRASSADSLSSNCSHWSCDMTAIFSAITCSRMVASGEATGCSITPSFWSGSSGAPPILASSSPMLSARLRMSLSRYSRALAIISATSYLVAGCPPLKVPSG